MGGKTAECITDHVDQFVMVDPPGGTKYRILGGVADTQIFLNVITGQTTDDIFGAQNGSAQRLVGKGFFLKKIKDHVVRCVVGLMNFLADHRFFSL
jgi:hypothetical protein